MPGPKRHQPQLPLFRSSQPPNRHPPTTNPQLPNRRRVDVVGDNNMKLDYLEFANALHFVRTAILGY